MRTLFTSMAITLALTGTLMVAFLGTSSGAALAQSREQACMVSARDTITQSSAYRNASARQKQQLLHKLNPTVRAKLMACRVKTKT